MTKGGKWPLTSCLPTLAVSRFTLPIQRSPWERGTNENTNGLIRQFFPKGTDFHKVTRYEVKKVQDLLNGRPRQSLNFQKPYEVFNQLINNTVALNSGN
jgi:IS30 family transposase